MELVKKLLSVSSNIVKIYEELIELEDTEKTNQKKFQNQIDLLKLNKEVEEHYYKKLFDQLKLSDLLKLNYQLNLDNMLEIQLNDFSFIIKDQIYSQNNYDSLVKRRIYNRILNQIEQLATSDAVVSSITDGAIDFTNSFINIGDKEFYIGNRGYALKKIETEAVDNIYLKYINQIQTYILTRNPNYLAFIVHKYFLSYLDNYLENILINLNFKMDLNTILILEKEYSNSNHQDLYQYFVKTSSVEVYLDSIEQILEMFDSQFQLKDAPSYLFDLESLEALICSCSLEIDEEMKEEQLKEISELQNPDNILIRNRLINKMLTMKKR